MLCRTAGLLRSSLGRRESYWNTYILQNVPLSGARMLSTAGPVPMHFKAEHTPSTSTDPPHKVIFLHGLFGFCDNWRLTVKLLMKEQSLGPCEVCVNDRQQGGLLGVGN